MEYISTKTLSTVDKYKYWALFISFLLLYIWIASQIPYTHDDWDWGIKSGIDHLIKADVNNRYAGNFIVVLLTRSVVLKDIVMGVVFTLIPDMLSRITVTFFDRFGYSEEICLRRIRIISFIVANIMILSLPVDVWRQTNGWVAGFSNFVVSGYALLAFYMFLLTMLKNNSSKMHSNYGKVLYYIIVVSFGIVIQLFLENISIYFGIVSSMFLAYSAIKKRSSFYSAMALTTGTVIGLYIMFDNSIYQTLWDTGYAVGQYRRLMFSRDQHLYSIIYNALYRYVGEFIPQIISKHGLLVSVISVLFSINGIKRIRKCVRGTVKYICYLCLCVLHTIYALYYVIRIIWEYPAQIHVFIAVGDLLFVCLITFEIWLYYRIEKNRLILILSIWLSPFVIMIPMVVINTVGPRSYYTTYLCLSLLCLIIMGPIIANMPIVFEQVVLIGLLGLCFLLSCHLTIIYSSIGSTNRERLITIQQVRNENIDLITLAKYPHSEYLWIPDPGSSQYEHYFKEFYDIPDKTIIRFEEKS